METETLLKIWLVILTALVVLLIINELLNPSVQIINNISDGNYTIDIGENMMKVMNQTGGMYG